MMSWRAEWNRSVALAEGLLISLLGREVQLLPQKAVALLKGSHLVLTSQAGGSLQSSTSPSAKKGSLEVTQRPSSLMAITTTAAPCFRHS